MQEVATAMADVKEIYTDGACSGNPGPGGWGTRIEFADGQVHELGGRDAATTNNRMEMQAAISALEFLNEADISSDSVILHTDSEYLKNGITKWIKGWKRKGWKTSAGKPVLNKDLWQQLDELTQSLSDSSLSVDWRYVRGHAGNPGNERCDAIARAFSHRNPIDLSQYNAEQNGSKTAAKTVSQTTAKPDSKVTTAQSKEETLVNDIKEDHRDSSLDTPEIKTGTEASASPTPTLESYERDANEGQQAYMVTASEKQDSQETSRIERLTNALKTLQVTDELAKQGYLITSAELADLMDVNASAVTSRGDYWAWRNWTVSRIRREGNQILWQLERIDE